MSAFEKPQKENPHGLTIRQHVHSRACISRFADKAGIVAVKRREPLPVFNARPDNDVFVAKRAWSHGLEHGLFSQIEARFQTTVDVALQKGDVDHEAVSDYAILWAIRDHFNHMAREPLELAGIEGDELTKDEEEILERKGVAFVRPGGLMPAHVSRAPQVMQLFDIHRISLSAIRWRVGLTGRTNRLVCPDAFRSGGLSALPINPTAAFIASQEHGQPDEMTDDLVSRLNQLSITDARSLVFSHPDDRALLLSY